jgi:hypothetical protein
MRMNRWVAAGLIALALLSLTAGAAFADDPEPPKPGEGSEQDTNLDSPIAQFLLNFTGLEEEEFTGMTGCGLGLGEIARAYFFAEIAGIEVSEILSCDDGFGWGALYKEYDLHPGGGGRGLGWRVRSEDGFTKPGGGKPPWAGPPAWAHGPKKGE